MRGLNCCCVLGAGLVWFVIGLIDVLIDRRLGLGVTFVLEVRRWRGFGGGLGIGGAGRGGVDGNGWNGGCGG